MRPLADVQNRDLRRVLSDEVSGSAVLSTFPKRFSSAPHSSTSGTKTMRFPSSQSTKLGTHSMPTTPALTDDTASVSSQECEEDVDVPKFVDGGKPRADHPLLSRPMRPDSNKAAPLQTLHTVSRPSSGPASQLETRSASATLLPPHLSSPEAISTAYLSPQTHKVAHGQLVVLPSKSLLVDFREGERRRGKQGNEVLLISPDGATVGLLMPDRGATLSICVRWTDSGI